MAKGTHKYYFDSFGTWAWMDIDWVSTPDVTTNTTKVDFTFNFTFVSGAWDSQIINPNGYRTNFKGNFEIGTGTYQSDFDFAYQSWGTSYAIDFNSVLVAENEEVVVAKKTITLNHNVDGSIPDLRIVYWINSEDGALVNTTYPDDETINESLFYTRMFTLPIEDISRKATITSAPNFDDKDNPTITYSNPAGNSAYLLQACIAYNGSAIVPYRSIPKTEKSYTFNLTTTERNALKNLVKSGSSVKVSFVIQTTFKNEDGTVKNLRSSVSRSFSIIPDAPAISATVEDVDAKTLALTGNKDTIVRYYSDAKIVMSGQAQSGATLASLKAVCGSQELNASGTMIDVESGKFVFYATDNYDNITSLVIDKTFIPYVKLTCNVRGVLLTDGNATLNIDGNFFGGSFSTSKPNTLALQYRHAERGANIENSSWVTINPTIDKTKNKYQISHTFAMGTGFDYRKQYNFQIRATDLLANVVVEQTLQSLPIYDWSDKDFNFNVPIHFNDGAASIKHDELTNTLTIGNTKSSEVGATNGIYLRPNGSDSTTGQVELTPDGKLIVNGLNLTGLARSMTQRYELPCTFTARNGYSDVSGSLYLYGNTIRGYVTATRDSNFTAGNAANENVCGVNFDSGGKVIGFGAVSFVSGTNGGVTSFQMTETGIYDSSSTEEGQGYFTITLCSTNVAGNSWNAYFSFPALLDLDKF